MHRDPRAAALARAVHRRRGAVPQRLMWPLVVVEGEILRQPKQQLGKARVALEVDVLVLDRAPEPLDEDVVERPPAPCAGASVRFFKT